MANDVLTENLSEPLSGTTAARFDIDTDSGNLTIDTLATGEQVLASGTLQYVEDKGVPTHTLDSTNGETILTVKGGGKERSSWFHLPWEACAGGAYEWQIHLNPTIPSNITARTGGGNVRLDLSGMVVTHLDADSGGGNMDVVLPDNTANLDAAARTGGGNITVEVGSGMTGSSTLEANSGAGNVAVHLPGDIAARVHATSGLGKVIIDPRFSRLDKDTYQSPDYDVAANKVEITAKSGAGNVTVDTKEPGPPYVRQDETLRITTPA